MAVPTRARQSNGVANLSPTAYLGAELDRLGDQRGGE
jgi:hypothetical protein